MWNMTKKEKLIQKVLKGKSDISPSEACSILFDFGYKATSPASGSSHITFRKQNAMPITIVLTQNPLKPYLVSKIQDAIKKEGIQ